KNKHSAASTVAAMDMGDVGSPAMKVAVAAALLVVFNLGYWYKLDREKQSIATKMTAAEQKNHELAGVKARYLERQKQAENYKRRVDVIDQLRAQQAGPVNLLNTIGSTGNRTEAVGSGIRRSAIAECGSVFHAIQITAGRQYSCSAKARR